MNDVIGIAWYKDEATYRRVLAISSDPNDMANGAVEAYWTLAEDLWSKYTNLF